ncbi:MAG: hypothetical protein HZR80_16040 [Candidatus Heimdallarchaeota archaeon]
MSVIKADYNVTAGTTYTFDVVASEWTLKQGTNTGAGTGFNFENTSYPAGTQFDLNVTSASTSSVSWNVTIGSEFDEGTNSGFDILGFVLLLFYPIMISGGFSTWDQDEIEKGPELFRLFFVDPVGYSDLLTELSNDTYVESMFTDPEWTFSQLQGEFVNSSSTAVFDWYLSGRYYSSADNTDFKGVYNMKFAFDKTTGAVKGFRMYIDYTGNVAGSIMEIDMVQHFEVEGYNLPAFLIFPSGFISGFELLIAIPTLAVIGTIAYIIKKRK